MTAGCFEKLWTVREHSRRLLARTQSLAGAWRAHVHKISAMRTAWGGALRMIPAELAAAGLAAFVSNWRERVGERAALRRCWGMWAAAARRNCDVRRLAARVREVRGCGRGG